jgi:hypothetical protein
VPRPWRGARPTCERARIQSARKRTRCCTAILLALMSFATAPAGAEKIWFGPLLPRAAERHIASIEDWHDLLRPGSAWNRADAQTQVFYLSRGYVMDASDDDLKAMAAAMAARGIVLAGGIQPVAVEDSDNCGKTEGYDTPRGVAAMVDKLKRNAISLKYLGLDGPLWFGHYGTGPQECRFSVEEVIRRTATNLRIVTDAFPDLIVGDIEGTPLTLQPGWQEEYARFKRGLEAAAGRPLAFLQLDIAWPNPDWPESVKKLAGMARTLGMQLGIIYNGDGRDRGDAAWIAHAWDNVVRIESELGIVPDQAIFVSWNRFPTRALPETSPEAHTWLPLQYSLPRTRFEARRDGEGWRVTLVDAAGHPLADRPVAIEHLGQDPAEPPPLHKVTGTVPKDAVSAILGWRINIECLCTGDNDLLVGDLTYREDAAGGVGQTLRLAGLTGRPRTDGVEIAAVRPSGEQPFYRVRVPRERHLLLNSPAFPVTPEASFELRAALGAIDPAGLYGNATVIWLGRDGKGLRRSNLEDAGERMRVGEVRTGADGSFTLPASAQVQELSFAGDAALRPALARIEPARK